MTVRDKALKMMGRMITWDTSVQFDKRHPVQRDELPAFVRGYVAGILAGPELEGYTVDNFSEGTIQQICRDCAHFLWSNREELEALRRKGIPYARMGRCLWNSRTKRKGGFRKYGEFHPEAVKTLHHSATHHLHYVEITDNFGELDYTWEDTNEPD